jgi:hypothetical protein
VHTTPASYLSLSLSHWLEQQLLQPQQQRQLQQVLSISPMHLLQPQLQQQQ